MDEFKDDYLSDEYEIVDDDIYDDIDYDEKLNDLEDIDDEINKSSQIMSNLPIGNERIYDTNSEEKSQSEEKSNEYDEDYNIIEDEIITYDDNVNVENIVHPENRRTSNIMTKYQFSKIIGVRAQQISQDSKLFINRGLLDDPLKMAEAELLQNRCPLAIKRYIGLNYYEIWQCNEMIKNNLF